MISYNSLNFNLNFEQGSKYLISPRMPILIRLIIRWRRRNFQTAQRRIQDEEAGEQAGEQAAEGAEEEEAEEGRGVVAQPAEEVVEGRHQGKFEVRVLIGWLLGIQEADWLISNLGYFMYRNFLMFFFRWGNKENISKNLYICYKTFLSIH